MNDPLTLAPQDTNLRLSEHELQLVCNRDFLLAKRLILQKIADSFALLEHRISDRILLHKGPLPTGLDPGQPGKISRGENLNGLPFIVLDKPSVFQKEHVCALRTLFWWGNGFHISIHLSGKYVDLISDVSLIELPNDLQVLHADDQWSHELSEYVPIAEMLKSNSSPALHAAEHGYFKITKVIPLERHETLHDEALKMLEIMLRFNG